MKNTLLTHARRYRVGSALLLLLTLTVGCEKESEDPLLACRSGGGNGIGAPRTRTVMFWTAQDFQCGPIKLVSLRNTETSTNPYNSTSNVTLTRFFATQPACGTSGAITIQADKGYEYEYTLTCTGRQWKSKVTVNCSSEDCIPIELK